MHAIPRKWKKLYTLSKNVFIRNYTEDIQVLSNNNRRIKLVEMKCKDFTILFLDKISQQPAAEEKWNEIFTPNLLDWHVYYKLPYVVTRDTGLQSLQYKIIHRIFPCNYWLSIWNNVSELCNYCNQKDTLQHYFYLCRTLQPLWKSLSKWWLNNLGCTFNLSEKEILLGIDNVNSDDMIDSINYCILVVKSYIRECRQSGQAPNLYGCLHFIKQKIEIEFLYYKLSDMKERDLEKWKFLLDRL